MAITIALMRASRPRSNGSITDADHQDELPPAPATDGTTLLTDKSYISQVKIGVNYRFSPGVVVAKY
jgi:hypothetical protein